MDDERPPMKTYLCTYFGSVLLALVATPVVIRLARRIGALDRGGVRAVHKEPIPRIGGAAIFFAAIGMILSILFLDNRIGETFQQVRSQVIALLGAAALIFAVGLVDDLRGVPARTKFLAEIAAAGTLCHMGIEIDTIDIANGLVVHLGWLAWPLTVLWIVGVTNAVNLSDGLDGLAAGVSVVACAVIAVFAVYSQNRIMAVFMLALLGSLCGFLFYNFNPAKVFMGDCGSLFLGFTIAASSVMCVAKSAAVVGLTLPVLALGVPIFDTLFVMLRRYLEGRSLFAPDRSHFHHRLLDLGLHQRQAVLLIYLVTLLAAGAGLLMLVKEDIGSLIIFGCVLLLITLLFHAVGAVRLRETLARLKGKLASSREKRGVTRTFEQLQLSVRQVHDPDEWWRTICQAAQQLELAWLSLRVSHVDGSMETYVWRRPDTPPGFSRIVTMTLPLSGGLNKRSIELEVAVLTDSSLESANHRAGLFTRLIDECVALNPSVVRGTS
jgi:UDP-GlcNAc:undecaprenyl-phosphate GlcNAc-1-phosphate transferase